MEIFFTSKRSLAHCVAEDFCMGAGIALEFRKRFGNVDTLLNQKCCIGDVAILKDSNRYIFYLVTKKLSRDLPDIKDLEKSLITLKRKMDELKIKKLSIPRLGCGLDRLNWDDVKQIIKKVFNNEYRLRVYYI